MEQSWNRTTTSFHRVPKGPTKMLGKGESGGYPPETTGEGVSISAVSLDGTNKKSLQVSGQLASSAQVVPQQQNQQLFLNPANLQLAQLQAQLALHRLKLAQGGGTASAATILNQVLSNVAMSHPLFNHLQTSSIVGNQQAAFPTGVLGFPSSNSTLGALVGGGFNQHPGNARLNHPSGGGAYSASCGPQDAEYGKKSGSSYPCDTDRRLPYNVGGGSAAAAAASDEQYKVINTQAKNDIGIQRDFYGQNMQGQQLGFSVSEQNMNVYNATGHGDQWKGPVNLTHAGKVDVVSNAAPVWTTSGQPMQTRMELYNPEEPTTDPKFNASGAVSSFGSSGTQGFVGCQPPHGCEETISSGTRKLQPYQVNDYHAVTPAQLPHQCSICDKKVYNLKDWDQHVKGKLHLQNRTLYTNESAAMVSAGAGHYTVGRPSDGSLNPGGMNSMVFSAASQDVSSGSNTSYLPAAGMSDTGFAAQQQELKAFASRKSTSGRVVHICNLPEGSCTENDVINLGLPFGKVTNYLLMRSTHQAFLEMAYVEAAQAMVQYYQLTPATINNQKLLIRMSKRYKELQLKKPGKDVQLIIEDITSQRERDEMQEVERYIPERARSRSPLSRSLSPHSHSPSFTSCSSAHSPQRALCRGQERGGNGLAPCRGSWDWSTHLRRSEDERERDDPWRNGGSVDDDRPNGRMADRRKTYQKPLDHISSRSADERGGSEGIRGNRDWHLQSSPQGMSFNSYRNVDDDFYMKEQMFKSDKMPRPSYQRHDTKSRRRDGGDYYGRMRHSEFEEPPRRTPEDKRHTSPSWCRSEKASRRHTTAEKHEKEKSIENTDRHSKDKSGSPQRGSKPKESKECIKEKDVEKVVEGGDDTDEECWYPKNMEELVTVDEVGGEDDSIVEPDLPVLEAYASGPKESAEEETVEQQIAPPTLSLEVQETFNKTSYQEESREDAGEQTETSRTEKEAVNLTATSTEEQKLNPGLPELLITKLSDFTSEEFDTTVEETCLGDKATNSGPPEDPMENHMSVLEDSKSEEVGQIMETITNGTQQRDEILRKEMDVPSPSCEEAKAVSIPLGVEFVVPRTGFYCKLCGLFYTSEDTAKTAHCRSTVHYRNLQKYLSQLAEESALAGSSASQ